MALQQYHGVKRSVSHSWEEDCHKISKHDHQNVATKESGINNNQTCNSNGKINLDLPTTSVNVTGNMLHTVSFSISLNILLQKCPCKHEKLLNTILTLVEWYVDSIYYTRDNSSSSIAYPHINCSQYFIQYKYVAYLLCSDASAATSCT